MTNEQLNTALYKKMFAEQEAYRKWLLSESPEKILNHTYEYTVREDILLSLEYNDLPDAQVRAMLKSPTPLADVFKDWEQKETGYMEDIWKTVENRAMAETQKQPKKEQKEAIVRIAAGMRRSVDKYGISDFDGLEVALKEESARKLQRKKKEKER